MGSAPCAFASSRVSAIKLARGEARTPPDGSHRAGRASSRAESRALSACLSVYLLSTSLSLKTLYLSTHEAILRFANVLPTPRPRVFS